MQLQLVLTPLLVWYACTVRVCIVSACCAASAVGGGCARPRPCLAVDGLGLDGGVIEDYH